MTTTTPQKATAYDEDPQRQRDYVASAAFHGKRPTKAAAFQHVVTLLDAIHATDQLDAVAALYAYFLPTAPKKPKTPLDWVRLAIDSKEPRERLRLVNVQHGVAVATNGHITMACPAPDGWPDDPYMGYDVAGNPVPSGSGAPFPDISPHMPPGHVTTTWRAAFPANWQAVVASHMAGESHNLYNIRGSYYSKERIDKALAFGLGGMETYQPPGDDAQLWLRWPDGRWATIMPVRKNWAEAKIGKRIAEQINQLEK